MSEKYVNEMYSFHQRSVFFSEKIETEKINESLPDWWEGLSTVSSNAITEVNSIVNSSPSLLNAFFQHKSDANKYLTAEQQEDIEQEFEQFVKSRFLLSPFIDEIAIVKMMDNLCIPSLPPNLYKQWEEIISYLSEVRGALNFIRNNFKAPPNQ